MVYHLQHVFFNGYEKSKNWEKLSFCSYLTSLQLVILKIKTDVNVPSVSKRQKTLREKRIFAGILDSQRRKEQDPDL